MIRTREQRSIEFPVRDHAAHRNAAKADAVIAALTADEPCARCLAIRPVIGNRDLERRVGRFRPRIAEKHMVEIGRRQRRHAACKLEDLGMGELEGRREVEFASLGLDCLDDRLTAMPGIGAPQPRRRIQHRRTVRLVIIHVLRAREHARFTLELAVRRERQPEGVEIVRCRFGAHGSLRSGFSAIENPERPESKHSPA